MVWLVIVFANKLEDLLFNFRDPHCREPNPEICPLTSTCWVVMVGIIN